MRSAAKQLGRQALVAAVPGWRAHPHLCRTRCRHATRPQPACIPNPPPCSIIFCEAVAIYGVIVAIILQTKLEALTVEQGLYSRSNMAAGYAIFAAGLCCGFSNLVCG